MWWMGRDGLSMMCVVCGLQGRGGERDRATSGGSEREMPYTATWHCAGLCAFVFPANQRLREVRWPAILRSVFGNLIVGGNV